MPSPDLPAVFVGVWERQELVVDGAPVTGAGRAVWVQAGRRFVDVREAGGGLGPEGFAGSTAWDPVAETLRWSHELDLHGEDPVDVGRVEWVGGDLVEHGTAVVDGAAVDYVERWVQCAEPGSTVIVAEAEAEAEGGVGALGSAPTVTVAVVRRQGRWGTVLDDAGGVRLDPPGGIGVRFSHIGSQWRVVDTGRAVVPPSS